MPRKKKCIGPTPYGANKFFLIEALRRSKKVMNEYKPGSSERIIFCARLDLCEWELERNDHDKWLSMKPSSFGDLPSEFQYLKDIMYGDDLNTWDLKRMAKTPRHLPMGDGVRRAFEDGLPCPWEMMDGKQKVVAILRNPTPEILCLALPMLTHPTKLIKLLGPFLKKRHAEAIKAPKDQRRLREERLFKNYFEDISAWRRNIRCYDLAVAHTSHKEIVAKIYPDAREKEHNKAIACVKSAIAQVKNMITSAENGIWPPER